MVSSHYLWRLSLPLLACLSSAQQFSPITPPSFPLAVRSPYLSAWLPGQAAKNLPTAQAEFWTGNTKLDWSVQVRVNGKVFDLFGVPDGNSPATVTSAAFTATHSTFDLTAGGVAFQLDFFSPVSFDDLLRQSLPFSYLTVSVKSGFDGKRIQIYSDVGSSWTGAPVQDTFDRTNTSTINMGSLPQANPVKYGENDQMAAWGVLIYAGRTTQGASSATGSGASLKETFARDGTLGPGDPVDSDTEDPRIGLAHSLGVPRQAVSVTFVIGYVRQDAVNYLGKAQTHYYRSQYTTDVSAVQHVFDDYSEALADSRSLDSTISTKGTQLGGPKYAAILQLSVRQIFGATEVVIPSATKNTGAVAVFVKEISSNGNLNTVDVIYPMFPFFYAFAPTWIKLMLEPMMQYLERGTYDAPYVVHDMGTHYPNATGHDDLQEEKMPVEECGNLIQMMLAYQIATGDKTWFASHRNLMNGYANYLSRNGEYPGRQLSTNDGLGSFTNMTNLAVKAAISLDAWTVLSGDRSRVADAARIAKTAQRNGLGTNVDESTGEPYFTITYQNPVYFMTFNLYTQRLLNLKTFPDALFDGQSDLFQIPGIRNKGVPIDGQVQWGKTDWQMWTAAVSGPETQRQMISDLYDYASSGLEDAPFGDRYWVTGPDAGRRSNFRARPTVGGHFALWALKLGPGQGLTQPDRPKTIGGKTPRRRRNHPRS